MKKKNKQVNETLMLEEEIPKRYRCFEFVVYDESIHYKLKDIMFCLHGFKYWAWIRHDPEDDEKQPHYHIIIKLDNACTIETISKKTGVPIHKIQPIRNMRAMCRYLIHIDDTDKIQYNIDEVHVSKLFQKKFMKCFEELKTEEEIIEDIYLHIRSLAMFSYQNALKDLILYVNANCYDTIYKRYRYEFQDYLKSILLD